MYKRNLLTLVAVAVLYAILAFLRQSGAIGPYWALVMDLSLITTISAVGLSLIYGFAGQFSLGHAAFYGVGAYAAGYITKSFGADPLNLVLALLAGAALAGLLAYLIGLPILRLRSDYLGIATLGFGVIIEVLMKNADSLDPALGGARGMLGIPAISGFAWYFWPTVLAILLVRNLVCSSQGRACITVREDEVAADIMGIDTARFKTMAFVIGCALAGLAGGLYAHRYSYLHPGNFTFLKSFDVLLVVVLGGLGSLTGTVVTAIGWVFLLEWLQTVLPGDYLEWRGVIYALILVVLMIVRPQGLLGGKELSLGRLLAGKKGGADHGAA